MPVCILDSGPGLLGAENILTLPNLHIERSPVLQCQTASEKVGVDGIQI